jgi:hypothetical protein
LDRFSDFSGASSSCDNDDIEDSHCIASGAVVAPVREMAAQIIAMLLEAASPDTCLCAHNLLSQLYTGKYLRADQQLGNCGWEIRHGVLLAWKYICAMKLYHSHGSGLSTTSLTGGDVDSLMLRPLVPYHHSTLNNIINQSIRGLSDASDDNRAVAAQVIQQILLLETNLHSVDIAKESSQLLWHALATVRSGVSSCAADLLQLLAELLSRRCETFVLCLQAMVGSISLDSVLNKLIEFIDDDSTHVKASCFIALSLVAEPIAKTIVDGENAIKDKSNSVYLQSIAGCTTALCRLLSKIFETYYSREYLVVDDKDYCDGMESGGTLPNRRNQAWQSVVDALALLTRSNPTVAQAIVDDCFTSLILRYFDIVRTAERIEAETLNYDRPYQLKRVVTKVDGGDNAFCFRLASGQALAHFFVTIYSEDRPCFLSHTIGSTLVRKV